MNDELKDEPNEKRKFTRISFQTQCELILNDQTHLLSLADISLKGVLITKPVGLNFNTNDKAQVKIVLSDSNAAVLMDCCISHTSDETIGLKCEHIDLDSITHLKRLVELNLGNEEILQRELSALISDWS